MEKGGYIYILSSKGRRLYVGVTSELFVRVKKHKAKAYPDSFTARYNIDRLVYYEAFSSIEEAIARETVIKNMHRTRKIALIVGLNPTVEPFDESRMRPQLRFGGKPEGS